MNVGLAGDLMFLGILLDASERTVEYHLATRAGERYIKRLALNDFNLAMATF